LGVRSQGGGDLVVARWLEVGGHDPVPAEDAPLEHLLHAPGRIVGDYQDKRKLVADGGVDLAAIAPNTSVPTESDDARRGERGLRADRERNRRAERRHRAESQPPSWPQRGER